MGIRLRDRTQLVQAVIDEMASRRAPLDTSPQTIPRDMTESWVTGSQYPLWYAAYRAYVNWFLEDVRQLIADGLVDSEQLDSMAALEGLVRRGPRPATGEIQFIVAGTPSTNVVVPAGTRVTSASGATGETLAFVTTETVALDANDATAFFEPALNSYAVTAPIQSVEGGSRFNLPANTIVTLADVVLGTSGVTNLLPTFGGTDTETDLELAIRLRGVMFTPHGITQPGGIARFLLNQNGVEEVKVLRADDPRVVRITGSGVTDVYVRDVVQERKVDDVALDGAEIILSAQPVYSINYVRDVNAQTNLVEGVDWNISRDETFLAGSSLARDRIVFVNAPAAGTIVKVSYQRNAIPQRLSALLNSEEYYVPSRNSLVFEARRVAVYLSVTVTRNATPISTMEQRIRESVVGHVESNAQLGVSVTLAGVIGAVSATQGVSNVDVGATELRRTTDAPGTSGDVTIDDVEYATIDDDDILVAFTN